MRIRRLIAIYIDYILVCMVVFFVFWLFGVHISSKNNHFLIDGMLILIIFSFKDIVCQNRSFGKRVVNLDIVSTNDQKLTKAILIFRNLLTIPIFPIELLMIVLINQRIGDRLFHTSVTLGQKNKM